MNAHTLSRTLATSMRPQLPSERLSVPEMVARLKASRDEQKRLEAIPTRIDTTEWYRNGDLLAAQDDRQHNLRVAIIAAVDAELERIGLTFAALTELNL